MEPRAARYEEETPEFPPAARWAADEGELGDDDLDVVAGGLERVWTGADLPLAAAPAATA